MTVSDAVTAEALRWVTATFDAHGVSYQVVGGLAARAHGSDRPLADIDLYAPLADEAALLEALAPRTIWGPEQFRDEAWDLVFMKLDFEGQRIEIGDSSSNPKFWDARNSRWIPQVIDFRSSCSMRLYGIDVLVMPVDELVDYKTTLARPVDLDDVRQISRQPGDGTTA